MIHERDYIRTCQTLQRIGAPVPPGFYDILPSVGAPLCNWIGSDDPSAKWASAPLNTFLSWMKPGSVPHDITWSPIYNNGSQRSNIVAVGALDIDCSTGNYFTKTIATGSTFTFSNAPSSRAYSFTLEVTHTSGTITWPTAVQWPGGTAPSLTTGKTHLFTFVTDDGGTRWRGVSSVNFTN